MNREEAKKIVNKCMNVILSCKNQDQLHIAVNYSFLAYRLIEKEIGLINNCNFITLIERSIGYAQCSIGNNAQRKIPGKDK